jgi:predicted glycoside hydrolase/deacetylase ChbG (UPF0249 family)
MKYLVVNADDFGYSYSVNKGIIEGHTHGIITSTTVLVDAIAAHEAAALSEHPNLSVGLHFSPIADKDLESEFKRQLELFESITGRKPESIDTHKFLPSDKESVEQILRAYSEEYGIPVRRVGKVKFIRSFFGMHADGAGTIDETKVTVDGFKHAVDEATDAVNEIMTHVGYCDDYLLSKSSYNTAREKELQSILDPSIRSYIESKGLALVNWRQLKELGLI